MFKLTGCFFFKQKINVFRIENKISLKMSAFFFFAFSSDCLDASSIMYDKRVCTTTSMIAFAPYRGIIGICVCIKIDGNKKSPLFQRCVCVFFFYFTIFCCYNFCVNFKYIKIGYFGGSLKPILFQQQKILNSKRFALFSF